jgi:hypothetical protein
MLIFACKVNALDRMAIVILARDLGFYAKMALSRMP